MLAREGVVQAVSDVHSSRSSMSVYSAVVGYLRKSPDLERSRRVSLDWDKTTLKRDLVESSQLDR